MQLYLKEVPSELYVMLSWRNILLLCHYSFCNPDSYVPHPVLFDAIDGPFICSVVLKMDSAAGPSATGWKRLCTSFHAHSNSLCDSIAILTRRLATEYVDPKGIEAFVAC